MEIENTYSIEQSHNHRAILIDCISRKLNRMDMTTLQKTYQAIAEIMDDLKTAGSHKE